MGKRTTERRRNEAALAALYDEYYDKIARYVFVRVGNRAEAEDIAGEVFLKALESLDSYKERGVPMQSWLFKIAHNLAVDHLRKMSKRKTIPVDAVQVVDELDPQALAETHIEFARVTTVLEQLTPAQRQVVQLRFFGELSSEEIARVMRKSGGAVRELQSAAIKSLRKLLDEESQPKRGE
ncbi:MAG: sigma-70 family RNA polymerase sigma factor [Dehalococcoidia bacterium]